MSQPAGDIKRAMEFDKESELLPKDLPRLSVRLFAWLLIALVAAAAAISVFVPFPEIVEAKFVLVPKNGVDPIKAAIGGTVDTVLAAEGKDVKAGELLFVISSQDLAVLDSRVKSLQREIEAAKPVSDAVRESRKVAMRSAEVRVSSLSNELGYMGQRKEKASRLRKIAEASFQKKLISEDQLLREQDADAEAGRAMENLRRALAEAKSSGAEMKAQQEREEAELGASRAKLEGQLAEAEAAIQLQRETAESGTAESDGKRTFRVVAPYDGTITSAGPSRAGAVIERGEILCSLAPAGAELYAELSIPELSAGRIAAKQSVRLLLDAYPYVRYGTRSGEITWLSPTAEKGVLRAHTMVHDTNIVVDGVVRPLRAGMSGKGRVRVGDRTLLEYALEPLRQLRENLGRGN